LERSLAAATEISCLDDGVSSEWQRSVRRYGLIFTA
jgi:hypothetical protein